MLMTAPSAGLESSHDISRGLISPVGLTLEGSVAATSAAASCQSQSGGGCDGGSTE